MPTSLISTGVQFPDNTIQTTAAVASSGPIGTDFSFEDYNLTIASSLTASLDNNPELQTVDLNGTSEIVFMQGTSSVHAAVWNSSTKTFGTPVLVRTFNSNTVTTLGVVKISTTSVLVCTLPGSQTALQTVVLTVSGSTITVNTPVSTTLATASNLMSGTPRLLAVGSSFVLCYRDNTTQPRFRAITVSGTTPTVGAQFDITAGNSSFANFVVNSTTLLSFSLNFGDSVLYVRSVVVSGTTLSLGGSLQYNIDRPTYVAAPMATGRIALFYSDLSFGQGRFSLVSLSGSAPIQATASTNMGGTWGPRMQVIGNRAFVLSGNGSGAQYTVMTDTGSGAPTIGTVVSGADVLPTSPCMIGYTSDDKILLADARSGFSYYAVINISSGTAVRDALFPNTLNGTSVPVQNFTDGYTNPFGNFPTTNNGSGTCLLRTATGKAGVFNGGGNPFVTTADGTTLMRTQQNAQPIRPFSDAISQAVNWSIFPMSSVASTAVRLRRVQLS